jgi:hypothetical protein
MDFSLIRSCPLCKDKGIKKGLQWRKPTGFPARRYAQHFLVPTGCAPRSTGLTEQQHQKADPLYETSKIAFA